MVMQHTANASGESPGKFDPYRFRHIEMQRTRLRLYRCDFTYPFATSGNNRGWKSPYQSAADAIDQAHRLADCYNRQFLRVLRQMRDLRRYAPPVIVNNGGQVNVASQQVNVAQTTWKIMLSRRPVE